MAGRRGRRVTIVGGGVMGLMTAYHAVPQAESVTVLERDTTSAALHLPGSLVAAGPAS